MRPRAWVPISQKLGCVPSSRTLRMRSGADEIMPLMRLRPKTQSSSFAPVDMGENGIVERLHLYSYVQR